MPEDLDDLATRERPMTLHPLEIPLFLDGRKTMIRRPVRLTKNSRGCDDGLAILSDSHAAHIREGIGLVWRPYGSADEQPIPPDMVAESCPWGKIGDRLWCREPYYDRADYAAIGRLHRKRFVYAADVGKSGWILHRAREMPREASRIILEITAVKFGPLRSINGYEAIEEGCGNEHGDLEIAMNDFYLMWERMFGKRPARAWAANPWCWVLEDVRPLADPVYCSGAQGRWTPSPEVVEVVRERLGVAAARSW